MAAFCEDCPDHEGCGQGCPCEVAKMVHKTTTEQGVPMKVTDPTVLDRVATLLRGAHGRGARG
jgi:hypothetical protein